MLTNLYRIALFFALAGFTGISVAQPVIIPGNVNLPTDSSFNYSLITALNGFLNQKEKPNRENTFVLKDHLVETSALLDELKGMDQSYKGHDSYKSHLTNLIKVDSNNFMIQLSYVGIYESTPVLRASFTFMAKKVQNKFYFYSPLKHNTKTWKSRRISNITFHFKDTIELAQAKLFLRTVNSFDQKLQTPITWFDFYFCDNFPEALRILGVDYKADYSGIKYDDLSAHEGNANVEINGGYNDTLRFDPHDLWHDRLHRILPAGVINRAVDEGCAYLYGGSWGYNWKQVLAKFKKYVEANPNADWLKLYTENANFEGGDKPMKVPYVLNALIVQKIEAEKGFPHVIQLLNSGPREKGDDNYFKELEKITGISRDNYNSFINELIKTY